MTRQYSIRHDAILTDDCIYNKRIGKSVLMYQKVYKTPSDIIIGMRYKKHGRNELIMTRTFEVTNEMVMIIQPGAKVTVKCDDPSAVTISHRPPKSEDYSERESTMLEFIHNISRLKYLDKVIDMYKTLNSQGRMRVMDSMEWTKYKKDYFVRDFIAAVNKEYSNKNNHQ